MEYLRRAVRSVIGYNSPIYRAASQFTNYATVVGTEGTLLIGGHRRTALTFLGTAGSTHDLSGNWLDRFAEAYRLEMRDFVHAILEGRPPAITGEDGRRALAIALAADAAGEQGGEISVG